MNKKAAKKCKKRARKALKAAYRAWEKERLDAAQFGQSHVNDIDAIFAREIDRIEKKVCC